jgi:prevent-host-death family protein
MRENRTYGSEGGEGQPSRPLSATLLGVRTGTVARRLERRAMQQFSLEDFRKKMREVLESARHGPVSLTKDGQQEFVLLSTDDFDRLSFIAQAGRVHTIRTLPDSLREMLMPVSIGSRGNHSKELVV